MKSRISGPPNEVFELVETLLKTGRRLEELTAGQVDTVGDRDGRTLLLRGTQEQLSQSEDARQAAILNALPAHIALLDTQGLIISVNEAWRRFGGANGIAGSATGVGLNYLEICDAARGNGAPEARLVAVGLRTVLGGTKNSFSVEYPCHSPTEQRWFQLTITPLRKDRLVGAVAMHVNITERHHAAEALRVSLEEFRTLAEAMPQIVWVTQPDGRNIYFNRRWMDYTGLTLEESLLDGWDKRLHPKDQERASDAWQHTMKTQGTFALECRLRRADGVYRWWLIRGVPLCNEFGAILKWFGTCTDIHDLKLTEEALFVEKESAQIRLNSIGDAVFCTDISGNITFLNSVACKMIGWSSDEATGKPVAGILRIEDAASGEIISNHMGKAVEQNCAVQLASNCFFIRRGGVATPIEGSVAPVHGRDGQATGAVIVVRDVSAARVMATQMVHLAEHDYLTDLPNRLLLNDRVKQAIALAQRNKYKVAVLFLDLDGFKHINDSLGHAIGDQLLQSIGKRLVDCVRLSDTVSRQGGDEFVVLLSEIDDPEDAAITARRMLEAVAQPQSIDQHDLHVLTSIGLSVYPDDGLDAETLIKNADTAMYQAKENGRQCYQFFKPAMNVRAVERQSIEESLRRAVERQEFVLHYQPKVRLSTGEITGAEALIRWTHPTRGSISPAQFIPVAEDCGLILPIGRWVLREACKQAQAWVDAGLPLGTMAVNVSAMEFRNEDFLEAVFAILMETGLDAEFLELELTETVLMKRAESTESVLKTLRSRRVQLAVDDFGTGYSSLSYLRKFPVDALKIDQSFVRQITVTPDDTTIVSAIISMGRSMKLRVIAEGVETQEELAFLAAHECDEGQGYLFGKPMPSEQFAKLLETGISQTFRH